MPNRTPHAQPAAQQQAAPQLPFALASRKMSRLSLVLPQTTLGSTNIPATPLQIPAVGFLSHLLMEVTLNITSAATAAAYTADAPFNSIASVELKNASGNDLIVPVTGYNLYLYNKWGGQFAEAPATDLRNGRQYSAPAFVASAQTTIHFFLYVPLEIDSMNGYGSIPALASNRSYQLLLSFASLATIGGANAASGNVNVSITAWYWSEPPAVSASGIQQAVNPPGVGTFQQWQYEAPPLTSGDKYIKSNNVGNTISTIIFVLRNSSGAREDTDWPAVCEFYLDNEPMFYLPQTVWEEKMIRWGQFFAASKDVANGLDTGVYVLPFHTLGGKTIGAPENTRAQLLPTVDASQLQLRGTSFGSGAATLEIHTGSVVPTDPGTLYAR